MWSCASHTTGEGGWVTLFPIGFVFSNDKVENNEVPGWFFTLLQSALNSCRILTICLSDRTFYDYLLLLTTTEALPTIAQQVVGNR